METVDPTVDQHVPQPLYFLNPIVSLAESVLAHDPILKLSNPFDYLLGTPRRQGC
jgi:hypothetical protein